jgi:hypothetical protein
MISTQTLYDLMSVIIYYHYNMLYNIHTCVMSIIRVILFVYSLSILYSFNATHKHYYRVLKLPTHTHTRFQNLMKP